MRHFIVIFSLLTISSSVFAKAIVCKDTLQGAGHSYIIEIEKIPAAGPFTARISQRLNPTTISHGDSPTCYVDVRAVQNDNGEPFVIASCGPQRRWDDGMSIKLWKGVTGRLQAELFHRHLPSDTVKIADLICNQ